ncbi:hypothetical protein [Streptomyces albiaxialis]
MSDKVLGLVLREERAGACVPEHGNYCYCRSGKKYYMNCYGICTKSTKGC